MKRVFSSVVYSKFSVEPYFPNEFISEICEGIQKQGGEILDIKVSYTERTSIGGEHLLIIFEDNGYYKEIESILKNKRNNVSKII